MKRTDSSQTRTVQSRALAVAVSILGTLGMLAGDVSAALPTSVSNPLSVPVPDGGAIADPEVIKFRGTYYLYGTMGPSGIRVWTSRNLVNWQDRGIAATAANAWYGWAPDVLQHNGQFYMVTSGDTGSYSDHVVMRSDSPLGPFVRITDTLPNSIDGNIFQDDDGKLYFFWAAGGGIRFRPMTAPNTLDTAQVERQLAGCVVNIINNWTEAPMVWKRNGTYYLSYTGNDWTRDDYQVHVCKGTTLSGLAPQANRVLTLDTVGSWRGAGHNTMVVGPDLTTVYNVYHERQYGGYHRNLGLSEAWIASDGQLRADAPESGVNVPVQPLFRDDFERDSIGAGWQQYGTAPWGTWNRELLWHDSRGYSGWNLQVTSSQVSPPDYVYEGSAKHWEWGPLTASMYPKYGLVSSVVKDPAGNVTSAFFYGVDARNNLLVSWAMVNGVDQGWQNTAMPAGWNHNAWHALRIEKRGNIFKLYYDDMLKQTRSVALNGGGFGAGADNTHVDFSSFAMNHNINGWYRITPRNAPDKAVEVGGWSTVDGGDVIQWTFGSNQANQLWWAQPRGGTGGVSFANKHSGKMLDVAGYSPYSGANVHQWNDVSGTNQTWLPGVAGGPWWNFRPNHAQDQCLDVSSGSPNNGANVQQWQCNGGTPQHFSLTPY